MWVAVCLKLDKIKRLLPIKGRGMFGYAYNFIKRLSTIKGRACVGMPNTL